MSQDDIEKIKNEIHLLSELDHPNIIKMYEAFEDADKIYVVQEILNGSELFDFVTSKSNFSEQDASSILQQIMKVLCYIHNQNIVHRDIKPENIYLEKRYGQELHIKIVDFKIATKVQPNQKLRDVVGSPFYIAPEVINNSYDQKCDVWSAGIILFIMLSGKPPFDGNNNEEILRAVQRGVVSFDDPIWKQVSGDCSNFINKLLTLNEVSRSSSFQALTHKWLEKKDKPTIALNNNVNSLKSFNGRIQLQQAALSFMSANLLTNTEKE